MFVKGGSMRHKMGIKGLWLGGLLWAAGASGWARLISVDLEYNADDTASFALNGESFLRSGNITSNHFALLSSVDGSLPLELFKWEGENLLAVQNLDKNGDGTGCGYVLTFRFDRGRILRIVGEDRNTKIFQLEPG